MPQSSPHCPPALGGTLQSPALGLPRAVMWQGPTRAWERVLLGQHTTGRRDLMNTQESAVTLKAYRRDLGP